MIYSSNMYYMQLECTSFIKVVLPIKQILDHIVYSLVYINRIWFGNNKDLDLWCVWLVVTLPQAHSTIKFNFFLRKNVSQRQIFRLPIINCNDHHNSTLRPVDKIHTVIWFFKQILMQCTYYTKMCVWKICSLRNWICFWSKMCSKTMFSRSFKKIKK